MVKALIDLEGNVEKTDIMKSVAGLDKAAANAAKQFKFIPAEHNGKPIKSRVCIPFNFKLK